MKPAVLTLLLISLLRGPAWAQFRLDSLPADNVALDKGFRWHTGDNPAWASPTFNDHRWDTLPAFPGIKKHLASLRRTGIGWIRVPFDIGSGVANQPLSLRMYQRGAADLYLDGKLIQQYGTISRNGRQARAYSVPQDEYMLLPPMATGRHLLAARITYEPLPWYVPKAIDQTRAVMYFRFTKTDQLAQRLASRTFWQILNVYWVVGFFLALALIYVFFYVYRRQRISLVFSLTMLVGAGYLTLVNWPNIVTDPTTAEWLNFIRSFLLAAYLVSLLITYHLHLQIRLNIFFWIGTVLMLSNILQSFSTSFEPADWLFSLGITAMFITGMTLSIRAIKAKKADGWVMLGSMILLIIAMTVQLFVNVLFPQVFATYASTSNEFTGFLFIVTVPLTLALLLARDNAQTNRQLAFNLAEVKQLSADKEQLLTQQKAVLERQVAERTAALQHSLDELRATQQQLVQREKMASLGELTAGIAHEIQNPLNFVNNFTEVSSELVQELTDERGRPGPERDEALQDELLADLTQNLEKIGHHGKRAASIVRGMLEHSRSSTGERQPTNLNALADEYLRLSYHGLRAKDKSFNATLTTQFDPTLPLVPAVGQDLSRVLLNLFNNAFYAVQQRSQLAPPDYQPTIWVSTCSQPDKIVVEIRDNGTGIPAAILDKIFQPFFTTKPTGQGTGLGLSLSYDIIVKGHGGALRVESKEGIGTTFLLELPAPKVPIMS